MRYLLYLSFHESFHSHLDKLLYKIFQKSSNSASVQVHCCKGTLPYCPAIDTPLPALTCSSVPKFLKSILLQTFFRQVFCTKCINSTNRFFGLGLKYRFAPLGISLYLKSVLLYFAREQFLAKLHDSCADNTISCYLVTSRKEIDDLRPSFKLARFLITRDYHIEDALKVLGSHSPDIIGMFNGRMLPFRSMLNVASKSLVCRSVIIHERGFEDSSFTVKINEPAHSRQFLTQVFTDDYKSYFDKVSRLAAEDWAKDFFEGRLGGSNVDCITPEYSSSVLDFNSIYLTDRRLVVFYLTTPDEIDPCSEEFSLIRHQWDLIPLVCRILSNSFGENNIHIVVRTHPNFFLRYNNSLFNLDKKIDLLTKSLASQGNVSIDLSPHNTSPFAIYKSSFLSVSFASSSLLESEYFGTPSLVAADHIYKHGVSYSFDFSSLLHADFDSETKLPTTLINKLNSGVGANRIKVAIFAYIWYYINTFRFDTVKYSLFNRIAVSDINQENSRDFNFIAANHCMHPVDFLRARISSFLDL